MSKKRNRPHPLVLLWIVLLLCPLVILLHYEVNSAGPHRGIQRATIDSGGYMYAWTRNRLVVWAALYLLGAGLLRLALVRDSASEKLSEFTQSGPGRFALPFLIAGLIVVLAFFNTSEVLLLGMAAFAFFFAVWARSESGASLTKTATKLMLAATSVMAVLVVGEFGLSRPQVVARTGGSLWDRANMLAELRVHRDAQFVPRRSRNSEAKPEGVTRILAVGDSFTHGQWVPQIADVWPSVLERVLNEDGHAVQVVNAGVDGTSTADHLRVLTTEGWKFDPDVVILQFTLNDTRQTPLKGRTPLLPVFGSRLETTSRLYCYLNNRFMGLQVAYAGASFDPYFVEDAGAWKRTQSLIEEIVSQATERDVPVLFLLFPMFDSSLEEANYANRGAHLAIAEFVEGIGVPILDVRAPLAAVDPDPRVWWARPFDSHPNAAAHSVVGRAVAGELVGLQLVGRPDGQ